MTNREDVAAGVRVQPAMADREDLAENDRSRSAREWPGPGLLAEDERLDTGKDSPMNTALLVIDVQQSFTQRDYFTRQDVPAFLAAQNALVEACAARGVPIVRIFHSDGEPVASNPWAKESGLVRPLDGLVDFEAAASFTKSRHSALVGSGLDVWLTQNGIRRLIVSGIRTEQCCETTTRHASDLGFEVDYVPEATLTFDMRNEDGSTLTAAAIKQRTVTVLKDRFAAICAVPEALARLAAA